MDPGEVQPRVRDPLEILGDGPGPVEGDDLHPVVVPVGVVLPSGNKEELAAVSAVGAVVPVDDLEIDGDLQAVVSGFSRLMLCEGIKLRSTILVKIKP